MFEVRDGCKEADDFFGTEHDRQSLRPFWRDDRVHGPCLLERDLIQKPEGGHGTNDRRGRQPLVIDQMQLVATNVLSPQLLRSSLTVPGEPCDVADVRHLRVRGEIANLHVLDHALTKRGHGVLPCERAWLIPGVRPRAYRESIGEMARTPAGSSGRSDYDLPRSGLVQSV